MVSRIILKYLNNILYLDTLENTYSNTKYETVGNEITGRYFIQIISYYLPWKIVNIIY